MNFDQRCALYIQNLHDRPHFTVGGWWNKSLHLQPLQRCYCENLGSPASACVMRRHYSMAYTQSLTNSLTNWHSRNQEVHYRSFISSPLISIFGKIYLISRITINLPQIHFNIILPSMSRIPLIFSTKTLYAVLNCSIRATCPAHLSRLDLRLQIMFGEEYSASSSALCNFLHSPVISSFLAAYIFILEDP